MPLLDELSLALAMLPPDPTLPLVFVQSQRGVRIEFYESVPEDALSSGLAPRDAGERALP